MTTDVPTFREFTLMRLTANAKKRARKKEMVRANSLLSSLRIVLHLAGFALLTIGAFELNIIAGYAVAGISCFVLSTLTTGGADSAPVDPMLTRGRP